MLRSRPEVAVERIKTPPTEDYTRSSPSPEGRDLSPFNTSRQVSASSSAATSFDEPLSLDVIHTKMMNANRRSTSLGAPSPYTLQNMPGSPGEGELFDEARFLQDFIASEGDYVEDLGTIVRRVASAWSKSNFPPPLLDQMFRTTEIIYRASELHFRELREVAFSSSSILHMRGPLIRWIAEIEGPYRSFFQAYRHSLDHYPPIASNPAVAPILHAIALTRNRSSLQTCTLDYFFGLPFARLRSYRKMYLKILRSLPGGTQDHQAFSAAVGLLGNLLEFARAQMAKSALDEQPVLTVSPVQMTPTERPWPSQANESPMPFTNAEDVESRVNPPNLTFTRTLRRAQPVVAIHTTPLSTRSPIQYRQPVVILLSDLFMVCEKVSRNEQHLAGEGKDFWLVYPPLAGKHLAVKPVGDAGFEVVIMRKEKLTVTTDSKRARDVWLRHFEDCIDFASSRSNPKELGVNANLSSQPPSPTYPPGAISPSSTPRSPDFPPDIGALRINDQSRRYEEVMSGQFPLPNPRQAPRTSPPFSKFSDHDSNYFPTSHHHHNLDTRSIYSEPAPQQLSRNGTLLLPRPPGQHFDGDGEQIGRARSADPLHPQNLRQAQIAARSFSDDVRRPRAGSLGEVMGNLARPPPQGPSPPRQDRQGMTVAQGGGRLHAKESTMSPSLPSMFFSPPSEMLSTRKTMASHPSRTSSIGLPEARIGQNHMAELKPKTPGKSVITAQLKCKVFLQQSHSSWKALGWGKLQLYVTTGGSDDFASGGSGTTKQLVVQGEKTMLISTILLPEGIERVGKLGVAVELSDQGARTGIVYMLQFKNEKASSGIYDEMLRGTSRART